MQEKNSDSDVQNGMADVVDIGALLLSQRESSGMSLRSAAKAVNLSVDTIECLENNQFEKIGNSVYVRGYLGLYSKYLGLDSGQIIHVYDVQHPAEPIAIKPSLGNQRGGKKQSKRHSKTLSFLVAVSVFGALLYAYIRFEPALFGKVDGSSNTQVLSGADNSSSSVDSIVDEVDGAQVIADDALNGLPVTSQPVELVSDLDLNTLELESSFDDERAGLNSSNEGEGAAERLSEQSQGESSGVESDAVTGDGSDVKTTQATSEESTLVMNFKSKCWLEIKDSTGKMMASGIFSSRRPVNVTGKPPFELKTVRKDVIKKVEFNGNSIELDTYKVSKRRYTIQ